MYAPRRHRRGTGRGGERVCKRGSQPGGRGIDKNNTRKNTKTDSKIQQKKLCGRFNELDCFSAWPAAEAEAATATAAAKKVNIFYTYYVRVRVCVCVCGTVIETDELCESTWVEDIDVQA